ncbi:hypothetical protein BC833DRAFT_577348 [Globomyces pollinis-pini]|nr:hypothetical protein BC833DRAFT_577348 [Globomyces pollinis-pini]KAJ2995541.1 hypothetical protein HDV02_000658 [Globomyces sp. JEL0801]
MDVFLSTFLSETNDLEVAYRTKKEELRTDFVFQLVQTRKMILPFDLIPSPSALVNAQSIVSSIPKGAIKTLAISRDNVLHYKQFVETFLSHQTEVNHIEIETINKSAIDILLSNFSSKCLTISLWQHESMDLETLEAFKSLIVKQKLLKLELQDVAFTEEMESTFFSLLSCAIELEILDFSFLTFSEKVCKDMNQYLLNNRSLRSLNINGCTLENIGQLFSGLSGHQSIENLSIVDTLDDELDSDLEVLAICKFLECSASLKSLTLKGNFFTDAHFAKIITSLSLNESLERVQLGSLEELEPKELITKSLIHVIKHNKFLYKLSIQPFNFDEKQLNDICISLSENTTLRHFEIDDSKAPLALFKTQNYALISLRGMGSREHICSRTQLKCIADKDHLARDTVLCGRQLALLPLSVEIKRHILNYMGSCAFSLDINAIAQVLFNRKTLGCLPYDLPFTARNLIISCYRLKNVK